MTKIFLDNNIVLYKNNNTINFLKTLNDLNSILIPKNIFQISSKSNILDTDFTLDKKVLYLSTIIFNSKETLNKSDPNTEYKKYLYDLKHAINKHTFNFIKDYVDEFKIKTYGVSDWTVCIQKEESTFHNNVDRDGSKKKYTVIVALNDDYTGGDFYFENRIGNEPIHMEHGDILIYPSNNEYRHKESEVTSGVKYSAVGYF